MKSLCVVDSCSLINLSEIKIAERTLHDWLFDEFSISYSNVVWDEIKFQSYKLGKDAKKLLRKGEQYKYTITDHYERTVFENSQISFGSMVDSKSVCRSCHQPIYHWEKYPIDLSTDEDKGERHNCCVAIDMINQRKYQHVIFLTDDFNAIRKYVRPIFESVPLGEIWSSHDFIVYLCTRHNNRINFSQAEDALRDLTAKIDRGTPTEKLIQRFRLAVEKVQKLQRISHS